MKNYIKTVEEVEALEKKLMSICDKMGTEIKSRKARSAWDKGVTAYALELLEMLKLYVFFEERLPLTSEECKKWLLNGAQDWEQFSWGGSSLIYDGEIAERLCTPSELKKTRNGERRPNSREEWLDVQAHALAQAARLVLRQYSRAVEEVRA